LLLLALAMVAGVPTRNRQETRGEHHEG
jgi:hypothetical protein